MTLKVCPTKRLSKLLVSISTVAFLSQGMAQPTNAQEAELDVHCRRVAFSTQCQRDRLYTQQEDSSVSESAQVIKIRLEISGPDNEWIRLETIDRENNTVLSAYHTRRVRRTLISNIVTGLVEAGTEELAGEIIDGYDGPVIVPDINFYRWADHTTRRIFYVPDGCTEDAPVLPEATSPGGSDASNQTHCIVAGTDTVTLPPGTNIRTGTIILEYIEQDLVRSIAFRIPPENS